MNIGVREVGYGHPVFIVAEISCNHNGSYELARRLVLAAAEAGADAVKFQCFTADEMTADSEHPAYVLSGGAWAGTRLYDLYLAAHTPWSWFPHLFEQAQQYGLVPFASVFGSNSLKLMEELNCPAYKIASAEVPVLELVSAVAKTKKPVLLSDGMATDDDLRMALRAIHSGQYRTEGEMIDAIVLRCVSDYPANPDSYALGFEALSKREHHGWLHGNWGISDHTTTNEAAVAAVALGACVVEKHLMLEEGAYKTPPLDAGHSITPRQFAEFVRAIRATEAMTAPGAVRRISGSQWKRRLVFATDLPEGTRVRWEHLRTARCSEGYEAPDFWRQLSRTIKDVKAGDPFSGETITFETQLQTA